MSRYNPHERNSDAVYTAAEEWRDKCLIGDSSILSTDDQIWTPQFLDELDRNFIQNPDDGGDSFLAKLGRQLGSGSDESKRLMAEIDWIVTLFPSNIRPQTKRGNVGEIWSWSGGTLDSGSPMLTDDVLGGLGHAGTAFNTHKWREIAFAILSFGALKSKHSDDRKALLDDPWAFARWLDEQPDAGNRQFRHILLNLVFPESFERITTSRDKLAILHAFEGTSMKDLRKLEAVDIDKRLKDLRDRLEREKGEDIDFYWGDIKYEWKGLADDVELLDPVVGPDPSKVVSQMPKDLFGRLNTDDSAIKIREPYLGAAVIFSNTHRRNTDAWFVLTADQIQQSLNDVLANIDAFLAAYEVLGKYDEDTWRPLFADYLTDDVARYMASVQTFPFFDVLSRAIHYSGGNESRVPRTIELSKAALERAIEAVRRLSVSGTGAKELLDDGEPKGVPAGPGQNLIFYGAPGTGKSHTVNKLVGEANVVRTVFHPDTQNSDFFGCLKPQMKNEKVVYSFVPGPFSNALRAALRDPYHQHFLVIEELNRAPAAAVFGELFQLLDRNDGGGGTYEVDFPNDESREWFNDSGHTVKKLIMPSNLSIIATMNSADHGVYPLDTAFRRRWEQDYLPLEAKDCPEGQLEFLGLSGTTRTISWRNFVKCLNDFLIEHMGTAEDRLLGQWFVQERELSGQIPAKILLYLWDDLLRHEGRERVFAKQLKTFGGLDRAVKDGSVIFGPDLLSNLDKVADPVAIPEVEFHETDFAPEQNPDTGKTGDDGTDD